MTNTLGAALLACSLLSVILATALWSATSKTSANRYLGAVLMVLAGMISVYSLGWTGRVDVPEWLAFLPINLPLALGPLLFGYVHSLATGRGPARLALHLAPAAAHFAYLCLVLILPDSLRAEWKEGPHDQWIKPLVEAATLTSLAIYAVAGLRLHRGYNAWLEQSRSDADQYAARWIAAMLLALIATLVVLIGVRFYTWFVAELEVGPFYLWLGIWAAWLGVEGWRHSGHSFPSMTATVIDASSTTTAPGLNWAELGAGWYARTRNEGWWREHDLSLTDLARRLGTNTTYLSRAVNEGLGMNFNEMINRMRAAEAARMIGGDVQANMMQIAFEAGFSSKATFNRVFRSVYGQSPSVYRRLRSQISDGVADYEATKTSEVVKRAE